MRALIVASVLSIALAGANCSVVDSTDREKLESDLGAVGGPDLDTLRAWVANKLYSDHFASKPLNLKIGEVWCTHEMADEEEVKDNPSKWSKAGDITVKDIVRCLASSMSSTYDDCLIVVSGWHGNWAGFTGENRGCYPKVAPDWETEVVNAEILGETTTNSKRLADQLTISQVADALIKSDTPPPLPGAFGAGGALFRLLPILCALGSGDHWGCESSPNYPGGGDAP